MQELSVTGATLVDQTKQHSSSSHNHDHHHHHGKDCCENKNTYQLPTIQLKKPAAELVKEYNDTQMMSTVNQVVRMGSYELFCELTEAWKANRDVDLHGYDTSGHTLTHWAAKRIDDVRFLQFFMNLPLDRDAKEASPLHRPTLDDTKMTPVHWLCTVGMNIPSLVLMLEKFPNILELRDGTNCTPLLIAAQHGHVETCAFLIQKGADHRAVDSSRDTATHWAAYKGSELVLGLMSFYDTSPLTQPDAYGQTPLHLAALRGHCGTVRYIIQQLRSGGNARDLKDALLLKDSNGRTAYELAVHKQKPAVAEILEQTMHPDFRRYFTIRTCKSWIGLTDAPDESPKLPYYFVILEIILHFIYQFGIFCPILSVGSGLLWDYVGMHVVQTVVISGIVYCLHKTTTTNPGRLDSSHPAYQEYRKLYEIAVGGTAHGDIQLCHSSHIARPLRSKHCRISRACVLVFDHHCPFVGATVGLYNYKWFYGFLLLLTVYLVNFIILLCVYYHRMSGTSHNTTIAILGLILGLHIFFPGGMLVYHTQLTALNLTTNEHLNLYKYRYLRNHRPYSPWDRGVLSNFWDRIVAPDERSYELPDSSLQGLLDQQRNGGV